MMKKIAFSLAIVAGLILMASFTTAPHKEEVKTDYTSVTFADLEAIYGENIEDQEGNRVKLAAEDVVYFAQANPNAGPPCQEIPCGQADRFIQEEIVPQANACCCSFTYGVECCQGNQLKAILYLVFPTDPACEQ